MKDKSELKSEVPTFRVTPTFMNMLTVKHKALNMKEGEFIRSAIMNANLNFKMSDKDIGKLIGSIGSIGNNINQIAHNLNIANRNKSLSEIDYEDMSNQLLLIKEYMRNLSC